MFPEIQVAEDLADDGPLLKEGDDFHLTSTAGTSQWIDLIDLLEQPCPVAAAGIMLGGRVGWTLRVEFAGKGDGEGLFASLSARGVGIVAIVTHHLLVRIGDV